MLADYDRAYGLKSVSLRYFNAAGADPEGRLGERHQPETHLIPLVLQAASGRRESVQVFGRDLTRRTEPASATTSTSPTCAKPTCSPWTGYCKAVPARRSTSAMATAFRCSR